MKDVWVWEKGWLRHTGLSKWKVCKKEKKNEKRKENAKKHFNI